jgi:DNA-3-methyladenine glycosylase II
MGLSEDMLKTGLDGLAAREPGIARALALAGYPSPRIRDRGYATLLRTIVGQQVSVAAGMA